MPWLTLRRTGFLALLIAGVTLSPDDAHAADSYDKRLNTLQQQLELTESRASLLESNIVERRGFIGSGEAQTRFEDAVYYHLVGDYGRAAREFFTLRESQAFSDPAVLHDIDWYLAESFFAMGNLVLALEAYAEIIDSGPAHPFFADSVRRSMEACSLSDNSRRFAELYESYIVPGRVEPTDVIRYTLGRAFHRQGDSQRAERYMVEIPETSSYYGRAQYHLGTFELIRDNLEGATPFFERAAKISIVTKANKDVVDLSLMALGRIHYELEDFVSSVGWYQQISRESRYFADALYEMTWTFIKDGDHLQALEAVDIFLLAFPEHARAPRMRLLEGKLHMKEVQYESALNTFDDISGRYTSLHRGLKMMSEDRQAANDWFQKLASMDLSATEEVSSTGLTTYEVEADKLKGLHGEAFPRYAVEMLMKSPKMTRTFEVAREISQQEEGVGESQQILEELEVVLRGGVKTLGAFSRVRQQMTRIEGETFGMFGELLTLQDFWLNEELEGAKQTELLDLRVQRDELLQQVSAVQTESEISPIKSYEESVSRVQRQARELEELLIELQEDHRKLKQVPMETVPAGQQGIVREQIEDLEVEMDQLKRRLSKLQSDKKRQELTAQLRDSLTSRSRSESVKLLLQQINRLKSEYDRIRPGGSGDFTRRVDGMWERLNRNANTIERVRQGVLAQEDKELQQVLVALRKEARIVADLSRDVGDQSMKSMELSGDAVQGSFTDLAEQFGEAILDADMGVVDVYWLRKVAVSDEKEGVQLDRQALLDEMTARFDVIRQGLEE